VLEQALNWLEQGRPCVLFCVVETWGASPRPPGALLVVDRQGAMAGSVSGGCVEDDLRRRVLGGEFEGIQTLKYGVTAEEGLRFGLPCGGTLQLLAEPIDDPQAIAPAVQALRERRLIGRRVVLDPPDGTVEWFDPPGDVEPLAFEGETLELTLGPAWQLILIGAGQLAQFVARFAQPLGYRVVICDPREEYRNVGIEGAEFDSRMPDDCVAARALDARSAVITLAHDPKLDDMALMQALTGPAFYVGALGSKRTSEVRRKRLAQLDLTPEQVGRLRAPVGLPLGSHTPPEIAIAILAELVAVRNGVDRSGGGG
jgi:xanthine dehydrogenase accessory factor